MSRLKIPLKHYQNQFIFRVHPDFFHNYPKAKQVNAASLQILNGVFECLFDTSLPLSKVTIPKEPLEFYYKDKVSNSIVSLKYPLLEPVNKKSSNLPATKNRGLYQFTEKSVEAVTETMHEDIRWRMAQHLIHLCGKVGVDVKKEHFAIINQNAQACVSKFPDLLRRSISRFDPDSILPKRLDGFVASNPLLFFSSNLTHDQRRLAEKTLYTCFIKSLDKNFTSPWWSKCPIIVTSQGGTSDEMNGVVRMPFDCETQEFLKYLSRNFERKYSEYQDLVSKENPTR